jgi:hypothetical protein
MPSYRYREIDELTGNTETLAVSCPPPVAGYVWFAALLRALLGKSNADHLEKTPCCGTKARFSNEV